MSKHKFLDIRIPIENDNPSIIRHEELCIKCGQCKRICTDEISVGGHYCLEDTNDTAICIHCGQCANVCPVNSITEVYSYNDVKKAIEDPDKIVIFSTSPSVRVALGEEFGMDLGSYVEDKMVAALRALKADYVLDTTFAADLTITEEASELVERITKHNKPLPQFTSCCPAWVKFTETYYPELIPNLSTAKSPIGMQGPTIKTYFAKNKNIDPRKIVNVAVTPCTAKKFEILRDEMNAASKHLGIEGMRDMDYVITTRELAKWIKEENIDFNSLQPSEYDDLLGRGSGAGIIFGNTGGVMEAAIRTAYFYVTGEVPPKELLSFTPVRGMDGIKEATVTINNIDVKLAIVHGTANARNLIEKLKNGTVKYDFIEVMTCRGGCIGGGGQPKDTEFLGDTLRFKRIAALYNKDNSIPLRLSHENPDIIAVYEHFYGKPLSELAEKMLHTFYYDRSKDLGEPKAIAKEDTSNPTTKKFICTVCGFVHEGDSAPEKCPVCGVGSDKFKEQTGALEWATEHVIGFAKGASEDILVDLRAHFEGECCEVGMYLAMARVAHREGYPEVGLYYEKAAWEEAEHAAKFAELLGEVVTDSTKKNLELRIAAENGATAGKFDIAKRAKKANLDAIHDTVHEMARDEARQGKAFEGLYNIYFK